MLGLSHLDRPFDYLVDTDLDEIAQPGVRVRVRFAGRLVDGYLLERRDDTDHDGALAWLDRVVSAERVLTEEIAAVCRAVADRYAGTMSDVLRMAVPPRHGRTETEPVVHAAVAAPAEPDLSAWRETYEAGSAFVDALAAGSAPRAVFDAAPGEDWPARLAELSAVVCGQGRGVVIVVPDQRDLDRLERACVEALGAEAVVALSAGLGPTARYRRWLRVLRGQSLVVVGTRSAVFAPVHDLGLIVVWDDGDDSLIEPRAPYPHPREVAVLRSHRARSALMIGGHTRTTDAHSLVEAGWAHSITASRAVIRDRAPRVTALDDHDVRVAGDPLAHAARIPDVAFRAARAALGRDEPVLFSVPRRGYQPSLSCARCYTPARCRHCHGPLQSTGPQAIALECRWCGRPEPHFRCVECGGQQVRAAVTGARRTAEELGRAFPGVAVTTSGGDRVVDAVEAGARLVVATPGAEPTAPQGYGAAIVLDTRSQLGRADLRAGEEAVRRWLAVATATRRRGQGGEVVIVADAALSPVQAVIRWDPAGFAAREIRDREVLGFPPAVTMASVDGAARTVTDFVDTIGLPADADVLGPVELPAGARRPAGLDDAADVERILLRVPRRHGRALAEALRAAQIHRGAVRDPAPLRVQVDPPHIG